MKKFLALLLVLVIGITAGIGGTVAYLTDTEEAVNVMTVGNVEIAQHEYQRAEGVAYNAGEAGKGNGVKEGDLVPFVQGQKLYPAFPKNNAPTDYTAEATDLFFWGDYVYSGTAANGLWNDDKLVGAMDKFVFVENTGSSDAYFRTVIAFECPEGMDYSEGSDKEFMMNVSGSSLYVWEKVGYVEIGGTRYLVEVATYQNPLKPGQQAHPSLLQVVMTHNATNEDVEKLGDTYDILVVSQAVQVENFPDAATALNAGFGAVNADNVVAWLTGLEIPTIFAYEGVNYVDEGDTVKANANGGDTVYRGVFSDGQTTATEVVIGEGITRLNNRALCKAPTLTSVTLPNSLTYIDESVFQESAFVEIEIPENVTYIGKTAFGYCNSLEKIVINAKNVTIASYAARACANLKEVYIYSDSVTFESGSMYFTNKESGDASGITFYVKDQAMADNCYAAFSTSHSYGMLIKSLDGSTTYYDNL